MHLIFWYDLSPRAYIIKMEYSVMGYKNCVGLGVCTLDTSIIFPI